MHTFVCLGIFGTTNISVFVYFSSPEQKFKEHIRDEPDGPAKRILRRDHSSFEEKEEDIPAPVVRSFYDYFFIIIIIIIIIIISLFS